MKNLSENTELLDFFQGVKQLKDIFFLSSSNEKHRPLGR